MASPAAASKRRWLPAEMVTSERRREHFRAEGPGALRAEGAPQGAPHRRRARPLRGESLRGAGIHLNGRGRATASRSQTVWRSTRWMLPSRCAVRGPGRSPALRSVADAARFPAAPSLGRRPQQPRAAPLRMNGCDRAHHCVRHDVHRRLPCLLTDPRAGPGARSRSRRRKLVRWSLRRAG